MKNQFKISLVLLCLALAGCKAEKYYLTEFNLVLPATDSARGSSEIRCSRAELRTQGISAPGQGKYLFSSKDPSSGGLAWNLGGDQDSCTGKYNILFVDSMDLEEGWANVKIAVATITRTNTNQTNPLRGKAGPIQTPPTVKIQIREEVSIKLKWCSPQVRMSEGIRNRVVSCASDDGSWMTLSTQSTYPN